MSKMLRAIPVLPSLDVAESLAFYKRLGFKAWAWEDPPSYGGAHRDAAEIHLFATDRKEVCEWTSCRIDVDDIESIHAEAQAIGCVHPNGALEDKPWNYREFSILDPSGVCIAIGQDLDPPQR